MRREQEEEEEGEGVNHLLTGHLAPLFVARLFSSGLGHAGFLEWLSLPRQGGA